jgi:RND family efflux transporter MFP subunit
MLIGFPAFANMDPPTLVKPCDVSNYDFYESIISIGRVDNIQSRDYFARTSGKVDVISAEQNMYVKKGQVLFGINYELMKQGLEVAEYSLKVAKTSYERDLSLSRKQLLSEELLDRSRLALEKAKLDLIKAQIDFADAVIIAPFDGYIGTIKSKVGDMIDKSRYLFTFIYGQEKRIVLDLPENQYKKITNKSEAKIVDIAGNSHNFNINSVSDYLSENGTIVTEILLGKDINLVHGSYVNVGIIYNHHVALAVPEEAVMRNDNGSFLYMITDDNKIKQEFFTPGSRTGGMIEVISDKIKAGDKIVLEGLTKIQDGSIVKFVQEE